MGEGLTLRAKTRAPHFALLMSHPVGDSTFDLAMDHLVSSKAAKHTLFLLKGQEEEGFYLY